MDQRGMCCTEQVVETSTRISPRSAPLMADNTFDPATTVVDDIKGAYTLDPTHSRLGFSTRHAMVPTVRRACREFGGGAGVDTENPAASKVEVTIKTASADTGVADRDGHLQSADFFDVENYPGFTFVPPAWAGGGEGG